MYMLLIATIPTSSVWMMGRDFGYSICPLLLRFNCFLIQTCDVHYQFPARLSNVGKTFFLEFPIFSCIFTFRVKICVPLPSLTCLLLSHRSADIYVIPSMLQRTVFHLSSNIRHSVSTYIMLAHSSHMMWRTSSLSTLNDTQIFQTAVRVLNVPS